MPDRRDQNYFRNRMKEEVHVDRNKAVPKCRTCPYFHPDFKYRKCLYATCPYEKLDQEVFRKTPLRSDKYGGGGMRV